MKTVGWLLAAMVVGFSAEAEARTWHVEKDGSGDYTVIQDALDAAASGDTIGIGPGRFEDFREYQSNGGLQAIIAKVEVPVLTIIGSGAEQTIIGPETYDWDGSGAIPRGTVWVAQPSTGHITIVDLTHEHLCSGVYIEDAGMLSAIHCTFRSGLYGVESTGTVQIESCRVEDCITGTWIKSPAVTATIRNTLYEYSVNGRCINFQGVESGIVESCTFIACATCTTTGVLFTGAGGAIYDSDFNGMFQAVFLTSAMYPVLQGNSVSTSGYCIQSDSEAFTAIGNDLEATGAHPVIRMYTRGLDHSIAGNHIVRGTGLAVEILGHTGPDNYHLDMTNNWWGTTDPDSIAAWIHDGNDVMWPPLECTVDFQPFATGPVPNEEKSLGDLKALYLGR